MQSFEHASLH